MTGVLSLLLWKNNLYYPAVKVVFTNWIYIGCKNQQVRTWKYFINETEEIKVDFLPNMCKISDFELPKSLENIDFSKDTLPIYNLPAV